MVVVLAPSLGVTVAQVLNLMSGGIAAGGVQSVVKGHPRQGEADHALGQAFGRGRSLRMGRDVEVQILSQDTIWVGIVLIDGLIRRDREGAGGLSDGQAISLRTLVLTLIGQFKRRLRPQNTA